MTPTMIMVLFMLFQGFCLGGNSIIQKKSQQGRLNTLIDSMIYATVLAFFQALIYLVLPPYRPFPTQGSFYAYTSAFSIGFVGQMALFMMAFRLGPASMTSTIRNLNMLVPITLGLFIWNEKLTWFKVIGMTIFITALVIMNKAGYTVDGKPQKISSKWLFTSICLLLVCGSCASISKQVMLTYSGVEKNYLLIYNLIVLVFGIPLCIVQRKRALLLFKDYRFLLLVFFSAALMSSADLVYVNFVSKYDSAFFMPLTSTVSMISVMIFSRIFLKEKISNRSMVAAGLCILAVIILSQ